MKTKIKLLLLGLFIWNISYGQVENDSVYYSKKLVPRFGLNIQKGYGFECGLFLNSFHTQIYRHETWSFLPYSSSGFYLASEFNFPKSDKIIYGPKVGWELGVIAPTHGSFFGAEFINYTDFKETYSPALMLKIGIPLMWLNISYGYSIFFENTLKSEIGCHRLAITYTINRKAEKGYRRVRDTLKNETQSN
jgi:hypothetical protein